MKTRVLFLPIFNFSQKMFPNLFCTHFESKELLTIVTNETQEYVRMRSFAYDSRIKEILQLNTYEESCYSCFDIHHLVFSHCFSYFISTR